MPSPAARNVQSIQRQQVPTARAQPIPLATPVRSSPVPLALPVGSNNNANPAIRPANPAIRSANPAIRSANPAIRSAIPSSLVAEHGSAQKASEQNKLGALGIGSSPPKDGRKVANAYSQADSPNIPAAVVARNRQRLMNAPTATVPTATVPNTKPVYPPPNKNKEKQAGGTISRNAARRTLRGNTYIKKSHVSTLRKKKLRKAVQAAIKLQRKALNQH